MKLPALLRPALAACALAFITAPISRADAPDPLQIKVGETVEITRSHSWCWFPSVHKFRSGEILVSIEMAPDQVNGESAVSGYCISRDQGKTWSRRYTMGQGANQDGAYSEVPDADDMIWQFGSYPEPVKDGDATHFYGTLTKYGRGGRFSSEDRDATLTLHEPGRIGPTWLFDYYFDGKVPVHDTKIETQFDGRPWGNIIQDRDGSFLCTCYYDTLGDNRREEDSIKHSANPRVANRFNRIVLLRSTDGGHSWREHGVIASVAEGERPAWVGSVGFNEGSVALLPDGRLYSVYRTGGRTGQIGHGWSSDGGKTWTTPASIGFQGVAPRVHRMSNGMMILVTGRLGPVVLRFNLDGLGQTWSHPVTIYSEMSTRYTDVAEIAPGRLLVVYDHVPYGWYEIPMADREARNIIYGTFVDVTKR